MDFTSLTLSDFYLMDIMVRNDGTLTPCIDEVAGIKIGLAGFNGCKVDSEIQIKEAAFRYYERLIEELFKKQ